MNADNLRVYALIQAANARVAGMQAANQQMQYVGDRPRYVETDFLWEADAIQALVQDIVP